MLATLLAFFGNLIGGPFAKAALDAYRAKLTSENTAEKIAADLKSRELELDTREADINAKVVLAEQGNRFTRSVRPLWAAPFVIYTWKAVVWDKVLGAWTQGSTDPLTGYLGWLAVLIAGAYFGFRGAEKIAAVLKR